MPERPRGRGCGRAIAAGVLMLAACRGSTPDAEPGAKQTAPAAVSDAQPGPGDDPVPKTSPDDGSAPPAQSASPALHGAVQGVTWTLVHDDRGDRLEIRRDQELSTIEITRDEQGCYITDAAEGRWCEVAKLAETLILFHPDVVKPSQTK